MNTTTRLTNGASTATKSTATIELDHPGVDEPLAGWLRFRRNRRRPVGGESPERSAAGPSDTQIFHSPLSSDEARHFVDTRPFERFGRFTAPISVARDGTIGRLARWLAVNRRAGGGAELWSRCREANWQCFRTFQVVALDRPSVFLPAGEVVFEGLQNPTQIPDRPPQGVMLRHLEAMDAFLDATFYFLRPVFVTEPGFRLCTADELRREAYFDEYDATRSAQRFGWAYRSQAWCEALVQRAERAIARQTTRLADAIDRALTPAVTLEDLRRRHSLDPVLCFELPSRPGELWFESHWYTGRDARTYVHY